MSHMFAWYYPNIWRFVQNCGTHLENNVAKSIGTTPEKKFDATVLRPAQLLGNNINEFRILSASFSGRENCRY